VNFTLAADKTLIVFQFKFLILDANIFKNIKYVTM
jgi:hypothetical protein